MPSTLRRNPAAMLLAGFFALMLLIVVSVSYRPMTVYAKSCPQLDAAGTCTCPDGTTFDTKNTSPTNTGCSLVDSKSKNCSGSGFCDIFTKYVNPAINFVSAVVGVVVIIMIVIGGIQYSSAGGDPQKVAAAKQRIANALLALLAYGVLFAFLQWLVPGGMFN